MNIQSIIDMINSKMKPVFDDMRGEHDYLSGYGDACGDITAELAKISTWQPLQTAPIDKCVDIWLKSTQNKDFGVRITGAMLLEDRWWGIPNYLNTDYIYVAGWMPVPTPME